MGNFDRGGRSGGGFSGNRGGSRGGFGGGRDGGRAEMFKATCAECGDSCQVPFRPTGERPVYCSNCFRSMDSGRDFERDDFSPRDRGDRDNRRSESIERRMFKATCADCGKSCEVPFKPTAERPVYCSDCFVTDDKNRDKPRKVDEYAKAFEMLNTKLDTIIKALEAAGLKQPNVVIKPKKKVEDEIVVEFEAEPVKKTTKKTVVKEEVSSEEKPAKKTTKKTK